MLQHNPKSGLEVLRNMLTILSIYKSPIKCKWYVGSQNIILIYIKTSL